MSRYIEIEDEIGDIILDALSSGYDVHIKITKRDDGKRGAVRLPMSWVNRLADKKAQQATKNRSI